MNLTGRIRTLGALLVMICGLMGLAACAGDHLKRRAESKTAGASLEEWLDATLIPYLVQQFGRHPRFKGQPILLVRMHNDDVQPQIDELTDHIRARIIDALVKEPGLDLYWRPATRPHKHHRSLAGLSCGDHRNVHYYIGIDCRLTRLDRKLEVRIRALNLAEHQWVSGFGRSWQGRPTAAQLATLKREHPDAYLRGLRPLPFADNQPDLLASYLARNLSCLFQQGAADDLLVHVEEPSAASPPFFRTTLKLVGKYLARFREVEVTDDPGRANVSLIASVHAIDQELYQIWITAQDQRQKKYLPGTGTEAYVSIDAKGPRVISESLDDQAPKFAPIDRPARPLPLITTLDLITPADPKVCATAAPWQTGTRRLASDERLPTGSCLAVELRLAFPAHVFLIAQDATGELTRLFPTRCQDLQASATVLASGRRFRFPPLPEAGKRVLKLQGTPGMERIYAIAVRTPDLASRVDYQLGQLQGLCSPGRGFPEALAARTRRPPHERVDRWQGYLRHLATRYPEELEWREYRFWHERYR